MDVYFRNPLYDVFWKYHLSTKKKIDVCIDYNRKKNLFSEYDLLRNFANNFILDSGSLKLSSNIRNTTIENLKDRYYNLLSGGDMLDFKFKHILAFAYNQPLHYSDNLESFENQFDIYSNIMPIINCDHIDISRINQYLAISPNKCAVHISVSNTNDDVNILVNKIKNVETIHLTGLDDFSVLNVIKDLKVASFDTDLWYVASKKGLLYQFIVDDELILIKTITFKEDLKSKDLTDHVVSKNETYIDPILKEANDVFKIQFEDFYNDKQISTLMIMNIHQIFKLLQLINKSDLPYTFCNFSSDKQDE